MADIERVKYSIERCISHVPDACRDCAYDAGHPYNECVEMMLNDALALLKEQEAVKIEVKKINNSGRCGRCPNCLMELNEVDYPNYCGNCGQAVKWE